MSVKARLEDAQLLYANGRHDGTLLSLLVAIAATARERYPKGTPTESNRSAGIGDRQAFATFLRDEMLVVTGGAVVNFNVTFRGEMIPLQDFFYKYLRCELAHEARLPSDVRFVTTDTPTSFMVKVRDEAITLSDSWMNGLSNAVRFAPENADDFPDLKTTPADVLRWFMFGLRRDSEQVSAYWMRREGFAESYAERHTR